MPPEQILIPAPRQARDRIYPEIPPDIFALLSHGKLEQLCPECGREEAAHWYCSLCFRQMIPTDWQTWSQLHPDRAAALRERAVASGAAERFALVRASQAAARAARTDEKPRRQAKSVPAQITFQARRRP